MISQFNTEILRGSYVYEQNRRPHVGLSLHQAHIKIKCIKCFHLYSVSIFTQRSHKTSFSFHFIYEVLHLITLFDHSNLNMAKVYLLLDLT